MKVWIAVTAAWVWWTVIIPAVWVCSSAAAAAEVGGADPQKLRYETVSFTTDGATRETFSTFMEELRGRLRSQENSHGFPLLRRENSVPVNERFVLVQLTNTAGQTVTMAIDVVNVYVVGYQAADQAYFFQDAPAAATDESSPLFAGAVRGKLDFESGYPDLQSRAGQNREAINLGINQLEAAIAVLLRTSTRENDEDLARSLLVIIQMISEAARFRFIEGRVRMSIRNGNQAFPPDPATLSLEQNWDALSRAIQRSNGGAFETPILLRRLNNDNYEVGSMANVIVPNVALILFDNNPPQNAQQLSTQFAVQTVIRPVLRYELTDDGGATFKISEPTVHIIGANGLCVDVKDGKFEDGNTLQLWQCGIDAQKQLWTVKTDETIRCNDKCMAASGDGAGSYVMIYDCDAAQTGAVQWEIRSDGTIINPGSQLVLSAGSDTGGTVLTVQINNYTVGQGWHLDSNTEPLVTSIVGFDDLCLHANDANAGSAVWIEECDEAKVEQQWALYADGSIRQQNRAYCLTCPDDSEGSVITITSCDPGSSGQRWYFRNDGTILNPKKNMVLDVKNSDPSLHQLVISEANGDPSQSWLPWF